MPARAASRRLSRRSRLSGRRRLRLGSARAAAAALAPQALAADGFGFFAGFATAISGAAQPRRGYRLGARAARGRERRRLHWHRAASTTGAGGAATSSGSCATSAARRRRRRVQVPARPQARPLERRLRDDDAFRPQVQAARTRARFSRSQRARTARDLIVGERTQVAAHRNVHLTKQGDHLVSGNPELTGQVRYTQACSPILLWSPVRGYLHRARTSHPATPTTAVASRPTALPSSAADGRFNHSNTAPR